MSISSSTVKKRVLRLARLLRKKSRRMSWRDIQREHYPTVNHATLNRIANSNGDWYPKDERILTALGIIKPRKPKETTSPDLFDMPKKSLLYLLDHREEVPPADAKTLKEWKRLGWLKAVRA